MKTCPKCKAKNRPEAAFCSNCGTILLTQPSSKKPMPAESVKAEPIPSEKVEPIPLPHNEALSEPVPLEPTPPEAVESMAIQIQTVEQPISLPGFTPQPVGTIFGDRFRYDALIYQSEHENLYTVTEIRQPPTPWITVCSNSHCRTIHVPIGAEQENFCTRCGHPMDQVTPILLLQEADVDRFSSQEKLIELQLTHPNLHPPIAKFEQELPGGKRYYLVTACAQELPMHMETSKVLEWGLQLADGLDYLHAHGVVLGEELDSNGFGIFEDKIVWHNFSNARVLPILSDREKINNVRLLALSLYSWISGNATYSADSNLNPGLNRLFQQALVGEGFTSGARLAQQINLTINASLSPLNLDYHIGQRTHKGKKRGANEDSMLCFTLSRVQQGLSQPAGIFAIADGMGGHANGELASSLTTQTILQKAIGELASFLTYSKLEYITWLKQTVQEANQTVYESRRKAGSDMGSTLVCALLLGNQAYLAHVGDSRVYLLREKSIQQLSTDHSLVQQMVTNGELRPDEVRFHPQRNVILRCLGEKPLADVEVHIQELMPGDRLLLCSDGLSGMLDDRKIQIIAQEAQSPQMACDYLVDSANLAGGVDNISVILVEVSFA